MSKTIHPLILAALLSLALLLAACGPSSTQTPTVSADEVLTQAAGTVAVQLTQNAALTPSPMPATATRAPTNTTAPTAEGPVEPTQAPAPTNTTAPSAPGQAPDSASFVEDVTIPDGTGAAPGIQFVKTWRIKNTGTTTWTQAYSLVYVDGERMSAPDSVPMPKDVRPGETVDISVTLTAPSKTGSHQTFFRLRNASGQYFRLDGTGDLWLKISVGGASPTPDQTMTANAPTPTPSATATPQ